MAPRATRIVLIILSAGIALVALLLILIASSPGEGRIRAWLESKLAERTGMDATISDFETNIWSRIQVNGLCLRSNRDDVNDTLLYLHSATITYALPDLIFGMPGLKSVAIDSLVLRIYTDSLGQNNLPIFDSGNGDSGEAAGKSVPVSVERISLTRLDASYDDSQVPFAVHLFDASAEIRGAGSGGYMGGLKSDSVQVDYDSFPARVTELFVDASWDGTILDLDSVTARMDGLSLKARGSFSGPDFDQLSLETHLEGHPGVLTESIRSYLGLQELDVNELYLYAVAGGSISDPGIELGLSLHHARLNDVVCPLLSVDAHYQSDTLSVDSLYLSALDGSLVGHGYILTDGSLGTELRMDVERTDLAQLWSAVYGEVSPYSGVVNGNVQVSGRGRSVSGWNVKADIKASRMRYLENPIPDADVSLSITGDEARLRLSHRDNIVDARVRIRESQLDGDFDIDIPSLSSLAGFLNLPELSGRVRASGMIGGTLDNPFLKASADGTGIAYMNFPADTVHADLVFEDSLISISDLSFSGELRNIGSTGGPFGLESMRGGFRYDCSAEGPLTNLSGSLVAHLIEPGYENYSADSINIHATLDGPRVALDSLDLFRGNLLLTANGIFDTTSAQGMLRMEPWTMERETTADDDTSDNDLSRNMLGGKIISRVSLSADRVLSCAVEGREIWGGLVAILDESMPAIDGNLDFDLSFNGPAANPAGRLSVRVDSIIVQGLPVDSIETVANLESSRLTLESLNVFAPEWSMTASASADLARTSENRLAFDKTCPVAGQISIDELNLSIMQPIVAPDGLVAGTASAQLTWKGTFEDPNLNGWLNIANGKLQLAEKSAPLELHTLKASLSESMLSAEADALIAERIPAKVQGRANIQNRDFSNITLDVVLPGSGSLTVTGQASRDNLDLQIAANSLDLSVLGPFLVGFDSLAGNLTSSITAKGQPLSPEISGTLALSDASLQSKTYLLNLNSGSASISFDREHVEIDSIAADVNGGHFNVIGSISHENGNITDIDLNLLASGMSFRKPELFSLNLEDARMSYRTRDDQYILDGDVRLSEARLTAGFRPQSILPWAASVESVNREVPEVLSRTRLDVRLRESRNLWVDNNLARIRMHAELGVIGTPARPNLTGMIEVQEGYLIYLDRRFPVQQGRVHFTDPLRFNPDVLISASTQVSTYQRTQAQKYTVSIKAEGPLDQLTVDLQSEPYLDKPDIVALLTLGATRSQLAGNGEDQEGGLKNAVVNRAATLTSRRVSGYISDKVSSMFGFEEFTVEGNLFQFDRSWGPQLVASRHLSSRLELTYSTTVGHLNDQSVRVGYRLMPRLSVVGETDRSGNAGVDLKYGIRFK